MWAHYPKGREVQRPQTNVGNALTLVLCGQHTYQVRSVCRLSLYGESRLEHSGGG